MTLFASAYLILARTRAIKSPHPAAWVALLVGAGLCLYAFMGKSELYLKASEQVPRFGWLWFGTGYGLIVIAAGMMLIQLYREPKARFF